MRFLCVRADIILLDIAGFIAHIILFDPTIEESQVVLTLDLKLVSLAGLLRQVGNLSGDYRVEVRFKKPSERQEEPLRRPENFKHLKDAHIVDRTGLKIHES